MIRYTTCPGMFPHVIELSGADIWKVLYYETGFISLHPFPNIIEWAENQGYKYQKDWLVARIENYTSKEGKWAICFSNDVICQLFSLKFL